VLRTIADGSDDDPWRERFAPPAVLEALVDRGDLGQKTGAGFSPRFSRVVVMWT